MHREQTYEYAQPLQMSMSEISFATQKDIPRLLEIITEYADAYGEPYSREHLASHLSNIINSPDSIVLTSILSEREYIITGLIAMTILSSPVLDEKISYKIHWIVDKKYPSRALILLRYAEYWSKMHGASSIFVSVREKNTEIIMKRLRYKNEASEFRKKI
jgi:hypothetical protein